MRFSLIVWTFFWLCRGRFNEIDSIGTFDHFIFHYFRSSGKTKPPKNSKKPHLRRVPRSTWTRLVGKAVHWLKSQAAWRDIHRLCQIYYSCLCGFRFYLLSSDDRWLWLANFVDLSMNQFSEDSNGHRPQSAILQVSRERSVWRMEIDSTPRREKSIGRWKSERKIPFDLLCVNTHKFEVTLHSAHTAWSNSKYTRLAKILSVLYRRRQWARTKGLHHFDFKRNGIYWNGTRQFTMYFHQKCHRTNEQRV